MDNLRIWIQRASEDNYSFITNKPISEMSKGEFMEFLLTGLRAGEKFMIKPGQNDCDVSVYYYDFLNEETK